MVLAPDPNDQVPGFSEPHLAGHIKALQYDVAMLALPFIGGQGSLHADQKKQAVSSGETAYADTSFMPTPFPYAGVIQFRCEGCHLSPDI